VSRSAWCRDASRAWYRGSACRPGEFLWSKSSRADHARHPHYPRDDLGRSETRRNLWVGDGAFPGLIFLPYYVVRRRFAALAAGLAVLAGAFLLPGAFYGLERNIEIHREWFRTLSESTPSQLSSADNVSLAAFAVKWSLPPELAAFMVLGLGFWMLLILRLRKDLPRPAVLEVGTLLVLIPLVSPLGWDYQFLTSALALTLLARHWTHFPRPARFLLAVNLLVIGLSIYDLMGRAAYAKFMEWSVLTASFLLLLGYLTYLRYERLE
jgi:hypothetical protein